MAFKKTGKFKRVLKRFKRKRIGAAARAMGVKRQRVVTVPRTQAILGKGFPKSMCITHKYHETFSFTSTLGVINKANFSCNSIFDPNQTGVGHQPLYFDQLSALYDHYHVIGSKATFTVTPTTANTTGFWIGAWIDDDASTGNVTDISVLSEQTTGKSRAVCPAATRPTSLTLKWSAKKYFKGSVLGNNSLQGSATTNPSEQSHYFVGLQGMSTGTSVTVTYTVQIEYIVVWNELKDVAQS